MKILNWMYEKESLTTVCEIALKQSADVKNYACGVINKDRFYLFAILQNSESYDEYSYEYSEEDTKKIIALAKEAGGWDTLLKANYGGSLLIRDSLDKINDFFKDKGIRGKFSYWYFLFAEPGMRVVYRDGVKNDEPGFDNSPLDTLYQ